MEGLPNRHGKQHVCMHACMATLLWPNTVSYHYRGSRNDSKQWIFERLHEYTRRSPQKEFHCSYELRRCDGRAKNPPIATITGRLTKVSCEPSTMTQGLPDHLVSSWAREVHQV